MSTSNTFFIRKLKFHQLPLVLTFLLTASLCIITHVKSFTFHPPHRTLPVHRPSLIDTRSTQQSQAFYDVHGHECLSSSSTRGARRDVFSLRSRRTRVSLAATGGGGGAKNDDDAFHDDDDDDDDYDDDDYDEDDTEEQDPLANGVDSISWLPPLSSMTSSVSTGSSTSSSTSSSSSSSKTEILPFFPLGGIVYTPNSEHVLNIFEPRYRQMYTDILMNGSKRFVVTMSHPEKPGIFAETGVIFYLDDLKEVSEETGDQIKYICNHKVTKRVKIHNIINPEAWASRKTYLKVEGTILEEDEVTAVEDDDDKDDGNDNDNDDDDDKGKGQQIGDVYRQLMESLSSSTSSSSSSSSSSAKRSNAPHEKSLMKSFQELVQKQHELEEDVRFTRASVSTLAVRPGDGQDSLWLTIRLWQSFIEQRLVARQNEMQMDFQEKLLEFLRNEKGLNENELPSAIGFSDLSPALQNEVQELQKRMAVELRPLVLESTLAIQKILEAENHEERCKLLKYFMDAERQRLEAKKQLRGMFEGGGVTVGQKVEDVIPSTRTSGDNIAPTEGDENRNDNKEEDDDEDDDDDGSSPRGSLFVDEPDAFQ